MVNRYGADAMLEAAAPDPLTRDGPRSLSSAGTALIPQEPSALPGAGSRLTRPGPRVPTPGGGAFFLSAVASSFAVTTCCRSRSAYDFRGGSDRAAAT